MENNNNISSNNDELTEDKKVLTMENKKTPDTEDRKASGTEDRKTLNIDENLAGLLCYSLGAITGIIFLILEKQNRFVKFHAMQSIIVSLSLYVIYFIVSMLPFIGIALGFLVSLISFALWILLMIKAYRHEWCELPIIGSTARDLADKCK